MLDPRGNTAKGIGIIAVMVMLGTAVWVYYERPRMKCRSSLASIHYAVLTCSTSSGTSWLEALSPDELQKALMQSCGLRARVMCPSGKLPTMIRVQKDDPSFHKPYCSHHGWYYSESRGRVVPLSEAGTAPPAQPMSF
jgi:hypothetical protein